MHIRVLEAFVIPEPALRDLQQRLQSQYGRDDLRLSVAAPSQPPKLEAHESLTALSFTVPELIENALKAEEERVDGILVDCMADPGVEVLRETVSIPVLGPGHTSMHVAALLGKRFSLLVTTDFSARYFYDYARRIGLDTRLASCRPVDVPPEEIETDPEATFKALAATAKQALSQDGADTLVLCCTGFTPFSKRLKDELNAMRMSAPLIDPFAVTINTLAMLIQTGLSQSRTAFPDTGISARRREQQLGTA